jgi:hypothetical protein
LSLVFNFFGLADSHLLHPPISAIGPAPPGSEPFSWAGASSTRGNEAAVAPKVVSGDVRGSVAAPALRDESPPIPTAMPPGSEETNLPLRADKALAPKASPSGSETARRDEKLAARTAIPLEPADPIRPRDAASGILNSIAHGAEQVGHDRHGTAADSERLSQRDTNMVTIKHHRGTSLQASSAHARRRSALSEPCQATQDATRCVPLRRVRARGPTARGAADMGPRAPPWNSAPGRFP